MMQSLSAFWAGKHVIDSVLTSCNQSDVTTKGLDRGLSEDSMDDPKVESRSWGPCVYLEIRFVLPRAEVECFASVESACEEICWISCLRNDKCYSLIAMVDELQVLFLLAFGSCCSLTIHWFAIVTFGWVVGLCCLVFLVVSPDAIASSVELWQKFGHS